MSDADISATQSSISDRSEVRARVPIKISKPAAARHASPTTIARDVFLFLVAFRILNALCIRTFFQPDEYFQALEPAWDIAFGPDSGAWITWVRSAVGVALYR